MGIIPFYSNVVFHIRVEGELMMQKRQWYHFSGLLAAAMLVMPMTAVKADFTGPYDLNNWTLTNTNADGSWNSNPGPPIELFLTGGDNGSGTQGTTDFTFVAFESGTVSFNWGYDTVDDPGFDSGGWLLNGNYTPLANGPGQMPFFDGFVSFDVEIGDVFGFRVDTDDNIFGPGILGVTNFNFDATVIPEPSTMALVGLIMAGGAVGYRKRRQLTRSRRKK